MENVQGIDKARVFGIVAIGIAVLAFALAITAMVPSNLGGLNDVSFVNLSNGQVVTYNSTSQTWYNAFANGTSQQVNVTSLGDVSLLNLSDGYILRYNSSLSLWQSVPNSLVINSTAPDANVTYPGLMWYNSTSQILYAEAANDSAWLTIPTQGAQGIQGIQGIQGVAGVNGTSGVISVSSPLLYNSSAQSLSFNQTAENSLVSIIHSQISDWASATSSFLTTSSVFNNTIYIPHTQITDWGTATSEFYVSGSSPVFSQLSVGTYGIEILNDGEIEWGTGSAYDTYLFHSSANTLTLTGNLVISGTETVGGNMVIDNSDTPFTLTSSHLQNVGSGDSPTFTGLTVSSTLSLPASSVTYGMTNFANQALLTSSSPTFASLTIGSSSYYISQTNSYSLDFYSVYNFEFHNNVGVTMQTNSYGDLIVYGAIVPQTMSGAYGATWASISLPTGHEYGEIITAWNTTTNTGRIYVFLNDSNWHYSALI